MIDLYSLILVDLMNKAVADDVPTADVLWAAAERIGKSNSGDQIQKICDYLVKYVIDVDKRARHEVDVAEVDILFRCSKHWFQTAGDLRVAQLATEEWHLYVRILRVRFQ